MSREQELEQENLSLRSALSLAEQQTKGLEDTLAAFRSAVGADSNLTAIDALAAIGQRTADAEKALLVAEQRAVEAEKKAAIVTADHELYISFVEANYVRGDMHAAKVQRLSSSLTTARAEAIREAAQVAERLAPNQPLWADTDRSDIDRLGARYDQSQMIAAAIRRLLPPDAPTTEETRQTISGAENDAGEGVGAQQQAAGQAGSDAMEVK